ncbi:ATP-binding cassette domain-containing protein [Nocardia camponoti]|uniref:UvrABC system protein A n=1 Tax=Nocardia camponoti TaxID=1616106 RepID=A0A917Q7A0_9NOCA|nr:excinuclease ABC subunit UvrA [Nocardia camponoti]GGK33061.1 excinuclease ABC subunit A [Nocardia camponoti]
MTETEARPLDIPADDGLVRVEGARVHNLRDVDVAVPRNGLVAFTGVSGSGKSSLAFGTIFAESQRRYLESVAPYARRLLPHTDLPEVDHISGLPPAVALGQRRGVPSSRSSVGTITSISNSLRLLFARAGDNPPDQVPLRHSDDFSPNTVRGACPDCQGLGQRHYATEQSMVPDPSLSIRDGAIASWPGAWHGKNQRDILVTLGYDIDTPWKDLPLEQREWILFTEDQPVVTVHPERAAHQVQRTYQGTFSSAERIALKAYADASGPARRERAGRWLVTEDCPTCEGHRLRPDALAVRFAGLGIADMATMPMSELSETLRPFTIGDSAVALLTKDVVGRIDVVDELGLGYLSLHRESPSLSSGELQRLRLASQLRSGLFGVVYVLDEPSAGLHPADTVSLTSVLSRLTQSGNSVFLVEHDLDVVRRADWVVDVGPHAGTAGGRVLYSGAVDGLAAVDDSVTARYLFDTPPVPSLGPRSPSGQLKLRGLAEHNLHDVNVDVPLGVTTAITGVSGSGKSTLLQAISAEAERDSSISRVVTVNQAPIGRTPRSNLATYTGMFDVVRKLFAGTDIARERGYDVGRFSFNVAGGRCPTCQGDGQVMVELVFLPSTYSPCPTCHGARYNPETLEVTYLGKTIADVLAMTVDEASAFLADTPAAVRPLQTLQDVGLGYLRLGQPATELSGGEAQRIKLAAELSRARRGKTLYLLDEPTTGLHPADADVLLRQLQHLVEAGGTVVMAEHDMRIVSAADHVIDMGPGGGAAGGRVVAEGTPREVADNPAAGKTAKFLAAALADQIP